MLAACCTDSPPTIEFMCIVAAMAASLAPPCMACVRTESVARLLIDDGFVLVVASCVFSRRSACESWPEVMISVGIRLLLTGDTAWGGADAAAPLAPVLLVAAIIAFNSLSVTPALCRRTNSEVEVLNLPGRDWIAETTTDSDTPPFTIVITSALVSGFCWLSSNGAVTARTAIGPH